MLLSSRVINKQQMVNIWLGFIYMVLHKKKDLCCVSTLIEELISIGCVICIDISWVIIQLVIYIGGSINWNNKVNHKYLFILSIGSRGCKNFDMTQSSNCKAPPSLTSDIQYENLKKENSIWQLFTTLDKKARSCNIFVIIRTTYRSYMRVRYQKLNSDHGVENMLVKLDT